MRFRIIVASVMSAIAFFLAILIGLVLEVRHLWAPAAVTGGFVFLASLATKGER